MPFPFSFICDLLQSLDDEYGARNRANPPVRAIVKEWFNKHHSRLSCPETDACAILSTLLPERRTDRVYNIQRDRLETIFRRYLLVGVSRGLELQRYKIPGSGVDIGDCIENFLDKTTALKPNAEPEGEGLTVEHIDRVLGEIASRCRHSSPIVRSKNRNIGHVAGQEDLGNIFLSLSARDAKWFARLILKDYGPIALEDSHVLRAYHPLLPQFIKVKDDLPAAAGLMRQISQYGNDLTALPTLLKPAIGVKVGRQPWFKGRSIKHCLIMGSGRRVRCEQKIDGEYCQIHVDVSRGYRCLQIFSKSGKDSTRDRAGLHGPIRESLRLGKRDCRFRQCILEGELVVYSSKENKILPFHKIRKHVSRSGSFLGTDKDSQPHEHEHLMVIYYDVLTIDDESLLHLRHSERLRRLNDLVVCREGYAEIVQGFSMTLCEPDAASRLQEAFAQCITSRQEGLVLKLDEPYFDFSAHPRPFGRGNIKLKKSYFQGLGDVGDFAVIGASYCASKAKQYSSRHIKWTTFYIGCLQNRKQMLSGNLHTRPHFKVVNAVELNNSLMTTLQENCRPGDIPFEDNCVLHLDLSGLANTKPPQVVFQEPLVFDICSFSFDKEPNCNFWSMRFPRVSKIHFDRSYLDTITYEELQDLAREETDLPTQEDSQEMQNWISCLEKTGAETLPVPIQTTPSRSSSSRANSENSASLSPRPTGDEDLEDGGLTRPPSFTVAEIPCAPVLPTPPQSSVNRGLKRRVVPASPSQSSQNTPSHGKRSIKEASPVKSPFRKKRCDGGFAGSKSAQSSASATVPSPSPRGQRRPLEEIDPNASFSESVSSREKHLITPCPSSALPDVTVSSPARAKDCDSVQHAAGAETQPEEQVVVQTRRLLSGNVARDGCLHTGRHCVLSRASLLLSPCIASRSELIGELLPRHGVQHFYADPQLWNTNGRISSPSSSAHSRRHNRKICLVDSRHREATDAFLLRIEAAALRMPRKGNREWVEVYDWRVLKGLWENGYCRREKKRESLDGGGEYNPWRQYFVGLA